MMSDKERNIESLYGLYAKRLFFMSLRITASEADAEEAMQDAFIKYFRMGPKKGIDNAEVWLRRVCIRNSIDILRRRKTDELLFSDVSASEKGEILNREDEVEEEVGYSVEGIRAAMADLPDGYRLIMSLYLFEGFDYEEIAQITGLKESSVRSQYMRGRKRLAEILKMKIK